MVRTFKDGGRIMLAVLLMAGMLAMTGATSATAQDASPEAAAGISVAPGPGEGEVTVTHPQGETVVSLNPEVVVAFDLASIDTLLALGIEVDGAPELANSPYDLSGAESVGTLFEPDFEAVAALEPDLIIVANRSSPAYGDLSAIGPTIDLSFAGANFIEELRANSVVLGTIFGKEAEAETAMADIDARVAALQTAAAEAGTGLIVITSGGALTALAPGGVGGRGSLIYETLGFQTPVEDLEAATHGEPISFEFLLEHNPDWLFVLDRDAATGEEGGVAAEQMLDNDIVHETTAYQNDQIVYLNPFDWYIIVGGGLESTGRMLTQLETAFGIE
ncbi:MAG: ABC transporter substrate-binding protein [Thermomicrobiales bacterium]|nr:ABC transporter substrate-binding protein [Thermomicrobiales bacterium]